MFAATHALLLDLVAQGSSPGCVSIIRTASSIPTGYFQSLAAAIAERVRGPTQPRCTSSSRKFWRAESGCAIVGGARHDRLRVSEHDQRGVRAPDGLADLRRLYRQFTNHRLSPSDTVYQSKQFMMRTAMASELNVLTRALNRLSEADRRFRDFTLNSLRRALIEVIACFPVYRTYVSEQGAADEDVAVVDLAIGEARRRNPVQEPSIFEFIRAALLPPAAGADAAIDRRRDRTVAFAHKFQQYTAPVVAKGVEDTAFYNDVLLLSANEVGGDLRYRTRSAAEFHNDNLHRLTRWPFEMTAGSTHDTKRGEDARARINVICGTAGRVALASAALGRDQRRRAHVERDDRVAPDRNDEWMFYQALVGAWPAEHVADPVPTAAPREFTRANGQLHAQGDRRRPSATPAGCTRITSTKRGSGVRRNRAWRLELPRRFSGRSCRFSGASRGSACSARSPSCVLRIGSPGVPDIYQGSELWNFSLVDPDNRQPVDFALRHRLLQSLESSDRAEVFNALAGRARQVVHAEPCPPIPARIRDLFLHGDYEALTSDIDDPHLIAFSRRQRRHEVIAMVPRFVATRLRGATDSRRSGWSGGAAPACGCRDGWQRPALSTSSLTKSSRRSSTVTSRGCSAGSAFQSWPVAMLPCNVTPASARERTCLPLWLGSPP